MRILQWGPLVCCAVLAGCGTAKWTDTGRTATEQLLISDSMDRAVSQLDFRAISGKRVYLDSAPLRGVTDSAYLISVLRQHMLAEGCVMMEKREEADYVVEVRAGAVGTDRRDVVFGVPATNVPDVVPVQGIPSSIPEMTLAKKTDQRAVTKLAAFAYNRRTGRPVWQSGAVPVESKVKDIWFFGAGPFQRGAIYEGTEFAGDKIRIPLVTPGKEEQKEGHGKLGDVSVTSPAFFAEPQELLAEGGKEPASDSADAAPGAELATKEDPSSPPEGVVRAGYAAPGAAAAPETPRPIEGPEPALKTPPRVLVRPDLPSLRSRTIPPASSAPRGELPGDSAPRDLPAFDLPGIKLPE